VTQVVYDMGAAVPSPDPYFSASLFIDGADIKWRKLVTQENAIFVDWKIAERIYSTEW